MAEGLRAWSVFGQIGLSGMNRTLGQLKGFDAAGKGTAATMLGINRSALLMVGGIALVGATAVGVGKASVQAFAEFDDAMVKSLAIMGDLSDVMRDELAAEAREVGRTTRFSATQAAESIFFLASAGLSAEQSLRAMAINARFAQAGNFDLARATDLLTDAQSALGLTIRDDTVANMVNMIRVSDALVKTNTLANATVEQFSESLTNRAAAALRLVNKDLEEGLAILAVYADQGIKGAEAGTRLDIVLRDLQRSASENSDEFRRLGIEVFDAVSGKMKPMADIIQDIEEALVGSTDETRLATLTQLGFQFRSIQSLLALVGFSDGLRDYEGAIRSAGDTTEEVAEKQMQSLREQMGLLGSEVKDLSIGFGSVLEPTVRIVVESMTRRIRAFRDEVKGAALLFEERGVVGTAAFARAVGAAQRVFEDFENSAVDTNDQLARSLLLFDDLKKTATDPETVARGREFVERIGALAAETEDDMERAARAVREGELELTELHTSHAQARLEAAVELNNQLAALNVERAQQTRRASLEELELLAEMGQISRQALIERLQEELILETEGSEKALDFRRRIFEQEQTIERERAAAQAKADALRARADRAEEQAARAREQQIRRQIDLDIRTGELTLQARLTQIETEIQAEELAADRRLALETERVSIGERLTTLQIASAQKLAEVNRFAAEQVLRDWLITLEALGLAFPALVEQVEQALAGLAKTTSKEAKDVTDIMAAEGKAAGGQLVAGIMQGMQGREFDLKAFILGFIQRSIIGVLTGGLGILSPSKKGVIIGEQVGAGLAVGLLNSIGLVTAATGRLTAAAIPQTSGALAQSITGSAVATPAGASSASEGRVLNRLADALERLPGPRNNFEAARDGDWQELLRESVLVAEQGGFRLFDRGR